jgi:broad specificity phosphatase PhoE
MIYLIRHAESESNAGLATYRVSEIPLTEKGRLQSVDLLDKIPGKPDLIVVSPYLRARQTALPLIEKYPDVPVEVWDVQEFTFLDADRCYGTTYYERMEIRKEYFEKNDPDFIHGKGAESFNQFLRRIDDMYDKLQKIDRDKFVVIFTHGLFIRTALARKDRKTVTIDDTFKGLIINNTDIFKLP